MTKNESDKKESSKSLFSGDETEKNESKRGNPHDIVQIYDTSCNKIRQARNFTVRSFEETDTNGEVQMKKSVEFYVVGNQNTWKMFIPFDEFVKANPGVDLPGEPN